MRPERERVCPRRKRLEPARILAGFALPVCLSLGLSLGIMASFGASAFAQSIPGVNGTNADPTLIAPDKNLKDREQDLRPHEDKAPQVDTGTATSGDTGTTSDEGPRFTLKEIQISGVTVFKNKILEDKFSPWMDKEVGYSDLLKIASQVTQLYKDNGYITSRAVLPPQEIENGVVKIVVVEGKIGKVEVNGNKTLPDDYVEERLHQKPGEVFRLQTLQKDMLNLSSDSLLDKTHATLKTGNQPGTSDLLIDVADHFPMHFAVGVDNAGRNGIGLWRTSYTFSDENVTGRGDNLILNAVLASHTVAAVGQYKYPLTTNGWNIGGNYSITGIEAGETPSQVLVHGTLSRRDITGKSTRWGLFTDFPIYRSPVNKRWDISGNVGLNFIDSMTYLDGVSLKDIEAKLRKLNPNSQTEKFPILRTLTSQLQAVEQDRTGRWLLGGTVTNGIGFLGGNDAYVKFNTNITRVQALPYGMMVLVRAEGQFTPNRLPFSEKMQLGGANSVRGYSEGDLIADAGYLLSAELRFPLNFLPQKVRNDWQGLVFMDQGQLFKAGTNAIPNTVGRPGSLFGYGVGLRGRLTKYLTARLDLGVATVRDDKQPDLRAHFTLNSNLF